MVRRSAPRSPDQLSAEELAVRARQGSDECFREIVSRYQEALTAFVSRRLDRPADADDVVQETFLRVHRNLDHYDPDRRFATWLYAIGKNVAANHRKAEMRRGALEGKAAGPEATVVDTAAVGVWDRARRTLSPAVYRALWLRYAQGMSVGEIAGELGKSGVSIKVMLFRARKRLLEEDT